MTHPARFTRLWLTPCALALALALGGAPVASADVVMPPPTDCPSGQVGVTSHGGPRCEKEAPDDCPAGWRGALGGTCMLTPCASDHNCNPGEACVEHSVCLEPSLDDFYDYGEEPKTEPGAEGALSPSYARELWAGPMSPRVKRPKPIIRYQAVNLCATGVACAAPRTCQPEKVCAPRGKRAVAYLGANVSAVRVARTTDEPLTQSEAPPTETAAPPPKGGCAACGVGRSAGSELWVVLAMGIGLAIARRAARR